MVGREGETGETKQTGEAVQTGETGELRAVGDRGAATLSEMPRHWRWFWLSGRSLQGPICSEEQET